MLLQTILDTLFETNSGFNPCYFYIDAWLLNARSTLIRIDHHIKHMGLLAQNIDIFLSNCKEIQQEFKVFNPFSWTIVLMPSPSVLFDKHFELIKVPTLVRGDQMLLYRFFSLNAYQ